MATTYTYSIQNDFPNHVVATDRLIQEVQQSAIVTALDHISTSGDDCWIVFKVDLSGGDKTILDGIVAAHSGTNLPQNAIVKVEAAIPFPIIKPPNPKITVISPNWCDKTTWLGASVESENEVATDSGDHTTYSLVHQSVIDVYHGKVTFEEQLKDDDGSNYRVSVKVNDVAKTEQDPHYGTGGDYTVDYAAGTITFLSAQAADAVVTVTYHYATTATFTIKPLAGKNLLIDTVEIQFSEDIQMNDTFIFQAYGYVDVFAPQLMPGVPSGTKIPLGDPLVYKTFNDLLNDSNGAYPGYPVFGGNNWRALKKAAYIFVWDYTVGSTKLYSAYGMEIRIDLQHNAACGGTFGVATLYCTSEDA